MNITRIYKYLNSMFRLQLDEIMVLLLAHWGVCETTSSIHRQQAADGAFI